MFAIIESLGRQYKVSVGDTIRVDKPVKDLESAASGTPIVFTQVLMLGDESKTPQVGKPYLEGATVAGEIVRHGKEKKVISFRKNRRKGYHKKKGFRRAYSEILIREIKAA